MIKILLILCSLEFLAGGVCAFYFQAHTRRYIMYYIQREIFFLLSTLSAGWVVAMMPLFSCLVAMSASRTETCGLLPLFVRFLSCACMQKKI